MANDRTEQLIKDVFTDEAARAVDSREVLAAVRGRRPRRSYGLVLAAAAVVVVVAAVATFVVPQVFERSTPPAADDQSQKTTQAVTPTNVLVVGTDTAGWTDSVVLTQVAADGSVSLISLPRDSWLPATDGGTKLNQIYARSGIEALLATVRDLTGVPVDHYAVVDMAAVGELADAVGGVPVCLNAATSDRYSGAEFGTGEQTIAGDAALAFLRQRHGLPYGDLDRIARLQAFLQSLAVKLKGADLAPVIAAVQGDVKTDPGLDVLALAQDLTNAKSLRVATIPIGEIDLSTPQGSGIAVDPAQVKQFVTGLPSTPPATGDVPCVN
ncbi:LCP family protein [Actinophytocola sp.]|uniref:LCP family protein n=1 Tax=Actinophytocola sp. TaxID=1872138 RepID=UPI002ED5CCF3